MDRFELIYQIGLHVSIHGIEGSFGWPGWKDDPEFSGDYNWVPDMEKIRDGLLAGMAWAKWALRRSGKERRLTKTVLRALEYRLGQMLDVYSGEPDRVHHIFWGPHLSSLRSPESLARVVPQTYDWVVATIESRYGKKFKNLKRRSIHRLAPGHALECKSCGSVSAVASCKCGSLDFYLHSSDPAYSCPGCDGEVICADDGVWKCVQLSGIYVGCGWRGDDPMQCVPESTDAACRGH